MADLLSIISLMFLIAAPFLLLAKIFNVSTAPALIVAGLFVGYFVEEAIMLDIARLGIALLVFTSTVRIQTKDFHTEVTDPELAAVGQLLIVGLIGCAAGLFLGYPPGQATFIGLTVSMSSSLMGSTLFYTRYMDYVHDWLSETIHSIQDFIALFLLMVVAAGTFQINAIAEHLGYGVILLVFATIINRYLYDLIGKFARHSSEIMLIMTVAILLFFLGAAQLMGTSIVVGAFAAGMAINYQPVKYSEVINGLDSINDFFAAIFFIIIGALVTLPSLEVVGLTALLVGIAVIVKPIVMIWILNKKKYERRTATLTGFNLDQVGEFALIFVIEALILGLIIPEIFEAVILAAAITLVTTSFTRYYNEQIFRTLAFLGVLGDHGQTLQKYSCVPPGLNNHIVIVGYGQYARRLVEVCEEYDADYVVIESSPWKINELEKKCDGFVFGDVFEPDTREMANFSEAELVISTADFWPISDELVQYSDQLKVILRTKDRRRAHELLDRGAYYVAVSDLLAADHLEELFHSLVDDKEDLEALRERSAEMLGKEV